MSQTTIKPASQMTIVESAKAYDKWLRDQLGKDLVEADLRTKHLRMAESAFPFLRATYWRWAETILDICPEFKGAPSVLGVGDLHLENFGTWRDDDGRLVWGVNDFDEAAEMPYPLDLVRLATSALLGCPHVGTARTHQRSHAAGLSARAGNPHPITLDHDYAWLRRLVVVPDLERAHFWLKMESLKPSKQPPPPRYVKVLAGAMPDPKLKMQLQSAHGRPRKPRPAALGRHRAMAGRAGGARGESRAAVGLDARQWRQSRALNCYKIATGRYRAPDPWFALNGRHRRSPLVAEQPQARCRDPSARTDQQEVSAGDGPRGCRHSPWRGQSRAGHPTRSRAAGHQLAGLRRHPRDEFRPARAEGMAARPAVTRTRPGAVGAQSKGGRWPCSRWARTRSALSWVVRQGGWNADRHRQVVQSD